MSFVTNAMEEDVVVKAYLFFHRHRKEKSTDTSSKEQ